MAERSAVNRNVGSSSLPRGVLRECRRVFRLHSLFLSIFLSISNIPRCGTIVRESAMSVTLTFFPTGLSIQGKQGDTVLDSALDGGIPLPHECGGNCACTTCHIRIERGGELLSPPEEVELDRLSSAEGLSPFSRLGCQAILIGAGEIVVTVLET